MSHLGHIQSLVNGSFAETHIILGMNAPWR